MRKVRAAEQVARPFDEVSETAESNFEREQLRRDGMERQWR